MEDLEFIVGRQGMEDLEFIVGAGRQGIEDLGGVTEHPRV